LKDVIRIQEITLESQIRLHLAELRSFARKIEWRTAMKKFYSILKNEMGATAIEYGLIAALVSVAAMTALQGLGSELSTTFNTASSSLQAANAGN